MNAENMEAILRKFIADVEAAGGIHLGWNHRYGPVMCADWTNLASTYLNACELLGHPPMADGKPLDDGSEPEIDRIVTHRRVLATLKRDCLLAAGTDAEAEEYRAQFDPEEETGAKLRLEDAEAAEEKRLNSARLYQVFVEANVAWLAKLQRLFGIEEAAVRSTNHDEGDLGTDLNRLCIAKNDAAAAWRKSL